MTYVIAEPCIGVKDRSCVDVCPVDCIYEGEDQLYIEPDECIDCGACVPECPVTAIFTEEEVPPNWQSYIAKNRDVFKSDQPPAKRTPEKK
jgi:ferredoxin